MKHLLLFCGLFLMISCDKKTKKPIKPSFLIGDWIRTNNKKGTITYETWHTDFTGLGITLEDKDTIFKEILSIVSIKDTLFLTVKGVNKTPTLFRFTQQTNTSFLAENPKNEFPKKIKYYLDDNLLKAEVSSKDYKIEFVFERYNSVN